MHHEHHETKPLHDTPDPWHDHSHDARPQLVHGEVANAGSIMAIGIVLFLVVAATVVLIYGFYVWYTTDLLNERETGRIEVEQRTYRQACLDELAAGGNWVDHETATVPIGAAMDSVVAAYENRK